MATRPRIAVFSTGGTIASTRSADGAASPNLTADAVQEFLEGVILC
jgi:L-asparaginase/Glu-tRNA(Gln) amidotransferase subunit D